ncbi:ABC transporter ATP-binding protein [Paenibacillus mendelii]|uniref:ABC transporter ATP-binding protein n=1 Tax=Paenibacillus mendelii TaxID=206163 RepID=A0ABV6J895_9BACL|nr:ABC transporter ATP-binding protein [Paenibacillus mendelii]MCQ6564023.1 ABC transporter ATP-binding protein/permease [Paenibacillus mendelii]
MTRNMHKTMTDLRMIKRACGIIRELSPGLLGFSITKAIIDAFIPYIAIFMSALIIDELVGNKDFELLMIYAFAAAGGTLMISITAELFSKRINVLSAMFEVRVKNYLNQVRLSMDFTMLEDPKYMELHARIIGTMFMVNGGITSVVGLLTKIFENAVSVIIAVIIIQKSITASKSSAAGSSVIHNPILFFLLLMAVIIVCIAITVRNSKTASKKEFGLFQNASTNRYLDYYHYHYMEDDQAAKDIHIFDQRKLIINEVLSKGRLPWMNIVNGRYSLMQRYFGANAVIAVFIGGFAYVFVGLRALAGSISLGSVITSYASIIRLVSSVSDLSVSLTQIKSNNNYLNMFFEYIDTPSRQHDGKELPEQRNDGWELEFHEVSFRYPSCETYAIHNLSMKISSKSRIAIVGTNGSGKTTLIKLLCGLNQPDRGSITLNGKDINELDYNAYTNLFSVVFQDFKLFAFPIGENVSASRDYEDEKVWHSLDVAGIGNKVRNLPLKLKQSIYKNVELDGRDLSGGEEQKMAIARALYKDAPIMIFDEPTAALDPVAEYEIYSKFNEIIGDKAAVFVSHRLSSCRFCDHIAVFHNGEIVQFGNHEELLEDSEGKYYELWSAQAQYYK